MADNNVIDIVLKPSLDTKEIQGEMRQIALTSKTAVEQSFKGLELTMRKSMEAWGKGVKIGKNVNMDEFVDEFREKMKELNNEIIETGNLPLGMTSKVFSAEQAVESLIEKYYKLQRVLGNMPDEEKYVETNKYSKLAEDIDKLQQKYNGAQGTIQRLEQEYANLQEKEQLVASVGGQQVIDAYNKQIAKIAELEEKIQDLRNLQGADPANGINRGLTGKALEENRRQIEEYQKQIEKTRNTMRLFGNDTIETLERIKTLEGSISPDVMSGGKNYVDQEIDARKQKMIDYMMQIDKLKAKLAELEQSGGRYKLSDEYKQTAEEIRRLEIEIVKAATSVNELNEKAKRTTGSFAQWRNVVWSVSRVLGNIYTLGLDIVRGAKMIANFYKKIWSYVQRVANAFKKLRDAIKKTHDDHSKSWKQMLKDVIRYSLGIRSLFMLFRRLRKYIREAFEAMAEQIPEVNQTLSELLSSFNMLKGSLATALEPIISAITPALLRLIDIFATLLTYIGMFFAALSGRGYVYKANKSMTSFASATGEAADNAKELNKQLQGFDELNNLTTHENKDKGGGGAGPLANFEKVAIPDWIKEWADKIKALINRILAPIKEAWAKVGQYVVDAWKRAFNSVKDLLLDIGRDFLRAWDVKGEKIAEHFLLIVGDVGHIIANIADKLREAWNYNDNGYKIWCAILDIVDVILAGIRQITLDIRDWTATLNLTPAMTAFREWLESLIPVAEMFMGILYDIWNDALKPILTWAFDGENSGIARFFRILKDFNDNLDKDKIRADLDKIWEAIGRFGPKLGDGLLMFMDRMSDRLADWLNSDDFTEWCEKVADFLDNIEPEDIADDLEQVFDTIKNVFEWVYKTIQYVIEHKDQILDFIEYLSEHLDSIAKMAVFGKLAIDLARFAANIILLGGSVSKALTSIGDFGSKVSGMFGAGGIFEKVGVWGSKAFGKIGGAIAAAAPEIALFAGALAVTVAAFVHLYNTSEEFREKVTNAIQTIKDKFSEFKENMQPAIDTIKKSFDTIKENLAELKRELQPAIDFIWKLIEGFFSGILNALGPLVEGVGNVINSLVSMVAAFLALLTGDFDGFWENLKNAFGFAMDAIVNIVEVKNSFIEGLFETFGINVENTVSGIKDKLIELWQKIADAWDRISKINLKQACDSAIEKFRDFKNIVIEIFTSLKNKLNDALKLLLISAATTPPTTINEATTPFITAALAGTPSSFNGLNPFGRLPSSAAYLATWLTPNDQEAIFAINV